VILVSDTEHLRVRREKDLKIRIAWNRRGRLWVGRPKWG